MFSRLLVTDKINFVLFLQYFLISFCESYSCRVSMASNTYSDN